MITIEQATRVIGVMRQKFNAMNFINAYNDMYADNYQTDLNEYINSGDPIQTLHQQIGRFLADHSEELHIRKIGDCKTTNTKGFVGSKVSEWEKI